MSEPSVTRPLDLLNRSLEARVLVKLKGGRELRGKLKGFDLHMNLILDEAEEVIDKNNNRMVGTVIVRGDNVILLSPAIKTEENKT
ncbi:MAG: LSM domain-containing protein [Candidatus Lokiarchaeia archaeon]